MDLKVDGCYYSVAVASKRARLVGRDGPEIRCHAASESIRSSKRYPGTQRASSDQSCDSLQYSKHWGGITAQEISMASPSQLYLLADHIKLSLLERQRAISLGLEPSTQDGNISRSLESMREGIESTEAEAGRQEAKGDE